MSETTALCTVNLNQAREILKCRTGMTLFAALRSHKIYLPTGCGAQGRCGQCKVKLLSGPEDLFTDSEVRLIPEEERSEGYRLGCQLRLQGDIAVQVPDYVFGAREYAATLREIVPLTPDIRRFSFTLNDGKTVPHLAGQFINLAVTIPEPRQRAIRCFSFATPSSVVDAIDIIVKLNPKGTMTPYLFEHARAGDQATIYAPFGDFHLRKGNSPCIWIGGGSGLSPFLGMLQDMVDKKHFRAVHLFFGAVKPSDLYYVDLLTAYSQTHDWFRFTPALSGEERCDQCRDYGLITDVVAKYVDDASSAEGYLCGSPGMIAACIKILVEKGMDRKHIFYDRF